MAGVTQTKVLFFGLLAERLGQARTVVIPEKGWTVRELREALCGADPIASRALGASGVRAAVDHEIAGDDQRVYPHQEIAFISPVSGG